jgi:hypothetical protein
LSFHRQKSSTNHHDFHHWRNDSFGNEVRTFVSDVIVVPYFERGSEHKKSFCKLALADYFAKIILQICYGESLG